MNALILAFASYCARETIGRLCALPRGALRRDQHMGGVVGADLVQFRVAVITMP